MISTQSVYPCLRIGLLALTFVSAALSQTITSVAGNASWGNAYNVAVDSQGNLYVADTQVDVVYKIDRFGATTVFAGTAGAAGFAGDGGPATSARLNQPGGTAIGPDGSVYIADYANQRIRKVSPEGIISTVAGSGTAGFAGDNGPALEARLRGPFSIAVNPAGEIYFVDFFNRRVRKISANGIITTVAGTGLPGPSGDGGPATAADIFPCWLAIGPDGILYITDDGNLTGSGNKRLRKVDANGIITTVAGTGTAGFSGDGGPANQAQLQSVHGVAVDASNNIYISDGFGYRIRKVNPEGIISTYAGTGVVGSTGDGGPALEARLNTPTGLAVDAQGNLYVVEPTANKVRKISPPPIPLIRTQNPVLSSFLGAAGFSSNTYVEIYGTNLATTSRLWAGTDFNGFNAPTSLDGVSVTVNGRPAFIYYISPGQININTPDDNAAGPVLVQVKNALGFSNIVAVNRSAISPTLQSIPQFNVGGKQYVVALTPDFAFFIGQPNLIQGVAFVLPKPGDKISIYALGLGPTNPPTQAGVVTAQNSPLALPFELKIGGVPAVVEFGGAVAGAIGLYQFNIIVPQVAPGDHPIELTVDGVPNAQNLWISIGQ